MSATAQLLPNVSQTWTDSNGLPLNGGFLYSYVSGTTTPQATYTDQGAGTPNTNPVVFNSSGQASVWLRTDLTYKIVIKDSLGNTISTTDNVRIVNPSSITKTEVDSSLAGVGLSQNVSTKSFDVQYDDSTIGISTNSLYVKDSSITAAKISTGALMEVVTRNVRDYTCPGLVQHIPQYTWSAPTKITNPGTLPGTTGNQAKWSPNGEFLAVAAAATPYVLIYQRSGTILTKLSNPGTLPTGQVFALTWSPCGDFLAVGCQPSTSSNPCVLIYQRIGNTFSNSGVTFTAPSGVNVFTCANIAFSPNSDFLAFSYQTVGTSSTKIFERNGLTFTDVTSTTTISNTSQSPMAWSADSSLFATLKSTDGSIQVYTRADNVMTSITPPSVSSYLTNINDFSFSPDGSFFAVATTISPYVLIFQVSSNAFSQLSNPATLPTGAGHCVAWSSNSQYLAVGHNTSPFITIYSVSVSTFTKIADPASLPVDAVLWANWSSTKQFLATCGQTTPFIEVYKTASSLPSNAFFWAREAPSV